MTAVTFVDKIAATADVFRLLSACFYEPDKQLFDEEDFFAQLYTGLRRCLPHKASLAQELAAAMASNSQQDLLIEYARLFVGPQELLAHPYGSVYLDGPKILMGNSTMNVIERYREADFQIATDLHEMPDHIAVELEFLYLLCYNEAQAESEQRHQDAYEWRDMGENFLNQHLGRWTTFFCDKIRAGTDMAYFRVLAKLTESFILSQAQKAG